MMGSTQPTSYTPNVDGSFSRERGVFCCSTLWLSSFVSFLLSLASLLCLLFRLFSRFSSPPLCFLFSLPPLIGTSLAGILRQIAQLIVFTRSNLSRCYLHCRKMIGYTIGMVLPHFCSRYVSRFWQVIARNSICSVDELWWCRSRR